MNSFALNAVPIVIVERHPETFALSAKIRVQ